MAVNYLEGFEPMTVEAVERRSKWRCAEVLKAFIATGEVCMGRHYGDDAKTVYMAFRTYMKRHKSLPVEVAKRGDMIILMRKDAE